MSTKSCSENDAAVPLTDGQINDLLEIVPLSLSIPKASALAFQKKTRSAFRRELARVRLRPSKFREFKRIAKDQYYKSLVQPGESVGILCAQSIGQMNTQMTLNSFHHAGISEAAMTAGVPRFQELLSATANPKIVNTSVYFIHRPRKLADVINLTSGKLKCLLLKDVVTKWQTYDDITEFEFNWKTMYRFGVYPLDVALRLVKKMPFLDFQVSRSTSNESSMPILRVNFGEHPVDIPTVLKHVVSGVQGIDYIFYEKTTDDEWFVRTVGSDYGRILLLPGVDTERTVSNNIWDIYNKLGIEAARESFKREFKEIMGGISDAHTSILVDRMTFSGTISSISRYTLKREKSSVFGKASFEESLENFLQASISGTLDDVRGNSASIVCGKKTRAGTGFMSLRMDLDALHK
jgi:DNA-directed RNA polymerase subunit A"